MLVLSWVISLVYMIGLGLPLPVCAFVVARSPAKWQTLKRMLLVFFGTALLLFTVGFMAVAYFESHALARLTTMLSIPIGMLSGTVAGWVHARKLRTQQPEFPSLSIRR